MGTLLSRRRYMGGKAEEMAFTIETNAPMLAVCYAKGWCANQNYMTKAEAAAVTSIGSNFNRNADIVDFDLSCFTSVTSIANGSTYGLTSCTSMELPSSLRTIGNNFMNQAANLSVGIINEGCTSIGDIAFSGCTAMELVVFPSTLTSLGSCYKGTASTTPHWDIIFKSVTPPGGSLGIAAYIDHIYVPDDSIQSYKSTYTSCSRKIYGKSDLPDDYKQYWPDVIGGGGKSLVINMLPTIQERRWAA